MNNMPTVLVVALLIDASTTQGMAKEAMVDTNVIGSDLPMPAPTCHQTRLLALECPCHECPFLVQSISQS